MTYDELFQELNIIFNDMFDMFGEETVLKMVTWIDESASISDHTTVQIKEKLVA